MTAQYEIKRGICDICELQHDYHHQVHEIVEKSNPDWMEKASYGDHLVIKRNNYQQFVEESNKLLEQYTKMCFYFLADCQGDSITICKDHLLKIIQEIDIEERKLNNSDLKEEIKE